MFGKGLFKLFTIYLFLFMSIKIDVDATGIPTASWYFRGKAATNGTQYNLNTGDTFVATCYGVSKDPLVALNGAAFVVTKSSPLSSATIAFASTAATTGVTVQLTSLNPTPIYDTINGNTDGYDHIIAVPSFTIPGAAASAVRGLLTIYLPYLRSGDAGKYYCAFIPGTGAAAGALVFDTANNPTVAISGSIELIVVTKSSSSKMPKNKYFEYSMLLISAYKFIF